MGFAGFLWAVAAYTVGFKAGKREGYAMGRATSRTLGSHRPSSKEVTR